jgi:hypothetical protein
VAEAENQQPEAPQIAAQWAQVEQVKHQVLLAHPFIMPAAVAAQAVVIVTHLAELAAVETAETFQADQDQDQVRAVQIQAAVAAAEADPTNVPEDQASW